MEWGSTNLLTDATMPYAFASTGAAGHILDFLGGLIKAMYEADAIARPLALRVWREVTPRPAWKGLEEQLERSL